MSDDDVTAINARLQIGQAIYGDDWIGNLRSDELELLRGQFGIQKKILANGRSIEFIDVSPPELRQRLDTALGRGARASAQWSSIVDWMDDHGLRVTELKYARDRIARALTYIASAQKESRSVLPAARGGRPSTVDWEAVEAALRLEVERRGLPDRDNAQGWRTQADVERWTATLLNDRGEPAGDSTIRDHVREMLARLR